ncbi:piggyBac transposable element-derived protein 4 [Strongylocentrotus purpuratus]|uniref:PiggyBac transposable element-derived protein domain-containing protein n=1 Tax=Strongylocentrotus purpuratus TaxID=7668 RepID=A0A7M7N2Y3_STRPU|nr:piggyBac transposable element-derived protein 4 [Strongylocentrotus purpuratus]
MRAVLGIIMYTGLVRLPAYNQVWSTNALLNLGIKSIMSQDYVTDESIKQEVLENDRGAMHQVVMDVSARYLNIGHHIYMDNLFSSPSIFEELASKDTGACGTLRANRRGVPSAIKPNKSKKDDTPLVVKEGDITYISWADKRAVKIITSVHNGDTFIKEVRAKNGPDHIRRYVKPKAMEQYTQNTGEVDLADQLLWHSLNIHGSCKWWKKIFFALLKVERMQRNNYRRYNQQQVDEAVERVKVDKMSVRKAVELYGIPKSTLIDEVSKESG